GCSTPPGRPGRSPRPTPRWRAPAGTRRAPRTRRDPPLAASPAGGSGVAGGPPRSCDRRRLRHGDAPIRTPGVDDHVGQASPRGEPVGLPPAVGDELGRADDRHVVADEADVVHQPSPDGWGRCRSRPPLDRHERRPTRRVRWRMASTANRRAPPPRASRNRAPARSRAHCRTKRRGNRSWPLGVTHTLRYDGVMTERTGAERYLRSRLDDPEYRAAYERSRQRIDQIDRVIRTLDDRREALNLSKAELARRAEM